MKLHALNAKNMHLLGRYGVFLGRYSCFFPRFGHFFGTTEFDVSNYWCPLKNLSLFRNACFVGQPKEESKRGLSNDQIRKKWG